MNEINIITGIVSSIATAIITILTLKLEIFSKKAKVSQEISKSDQDKITTASQTIDLVEKLTESMNKRFNESEAREREMNKKIVDLEKVVQDYKLTCDNCEVRIKTKRKP